MNIDNLLSSLMYMKQKEYKILQLYYSLPDIPAVGSCNLPDQVQP